MKYNKEVKLKTGQNIILRNGTKEDGDKVLEVFTKTHGETDYLLTYPDENTFNSIVEGEFLAGKTENPKEIEIVAEINGKIVGMAGIECAGEKVKTRHRAEYGIAILKEYWGLGIGRALTNSCIECAKEAGYKQLELTVVAENEKALRLYETLGFAEFGRNPKGYVSRNSGYQEIVHMRMEL